MVLTALCFSLLVATPTPESAESIEPLVIYRNGLRSGWQDFGWTRRDVLSGQPARVDFFDHGGWIIGGRETKGHYQALLLWMRAPAGHGQFLSVRLAGKEGGAFPMVPITRELTRARKGKWREIRVPYDLLNPDDEAFDTITLSATRPVPTGWVYIDNIVLDPNAAEEFVAMVEELDDDGTSVTEMVDVVMDTPRIVGVGVHLGGGLPAGGGSPAFAAGLSARLSFADGHIGVGVQGSVSRHSLAVRTADPAGVSIDASSNVTRVPVLGALTLRLPSLGPVAVYGRTGCGGVWIWASQDLLGATRSATALAWAVYGGGGAELELGPGWLGVEAGYLILPVVELSGVLREYHGGGFTMMLHYRFGA